MAWGACLLAPPPLCTNSLDLKSCPHPEGSSHHGQLGLQLLHAVVLEVQLGAQGCRVVRGLLGLASQLPLLPLQQVLLLGQSLDRILAFLQRGRK